MPKKKATKNPATLADVKKELQQVKSVLIEIRDQQPASFTNKSGVYILSQITVGVLRGFGTIVGATILVAIIVVILQKLGVFEMFAEFLKNAQIIF